MCAQTKKNVLRLTRWKNKMWLEAKTRKHLAEETENCFNSNSHWVVESATKRCGQEGTVARSQQKLGKSN